MVIYELRKTIKERLESALKDNAAFEADLIIMNCTGMSKSEYVINSRKAVEESIIKKVLDLAKRRALGEPIQYILGSAEFMSLEFKVDPHTLIPRSDTETLVEMAISRVGNRAVRILDVGTGSGCIGISVAHYCRNARVTLLDISREALTVAEENAVSNGVIERVDVTQTDIMSEIPEGKFDMILSNPPYIESDVIPTLECEVKDHEPLSALDGGADGLMFYRRITGIIPYILNKGGYLIFEIGYNQAEAVSEIMSENCRDIQIIKDLAGNDRVVIGEYE